MQTQKERERERERERQTENERVEATIKYEPLAFGVTASTR